MTKFFERDTTPKTIGKRAIFRRKKFLSIAFLGFGFTLPSQSAKALDYEVLGQVLGIRSEFQSYLELPLRQKLIVPENNNLSAPSPRDASNWTGCQIGKGILSGTARDISACAASAYYGQDISTDQLARLSYEDAACIIESIWDGIQASRIMDQDLANLVMHIKMHYGNLRIVQIALNDMGAGLQVNGRMDEATLNALAQRSFWQPVATYNQVRNSLKKAYKRSPYRNAFIRALNEEFPVREHWAKPYLDLANEWKDQLFYQWEEMACHFNQLTEETGIAA